MILGETGCGKSSLINRVFGKKIAYVNDTDRGTETFQKYEGRKFGIGVNLIDSRGYELSNGSNETFKSYTDSIKNEMEKSCKSYDPYAKVHIVWYCVSLTGGRFQDYDRDTLNMLLSYEELKNRVCVLVTKCDEDCEDQSESEQLISAIKEHIPNIVPIFRVSENPEYPFDLEKLIEYSAEQLDDSDMKEMFIKSQVISLKAKRISAGGKIAIYSAIAGAVGASPIPIADAAILTPLQVMMSTHIIISYGLGDMANVAKSVVGATILPALGKSLAGGLLKLIPGIGTIAGSAINAAVATSFTAALGCAISQICFSCCEKIARGEEVDFENEFTTENIASFTKAFSKVSKEENEYLSDEKPDKKEIRALTDSYKKEYGNNKD